MIIRARGGLTALAADDAGGVTANAWLLFGGFYASEPQGRRFAGVGRLY